MREIAPTAILQATLLLALSDLGARVSLARRKRELTMEEAAQLAGITRGTWARLERGGAEVSLGVLVRALDALGLLEHLAAVAGAAGDRVGLELDAARIPVRVRKRR